jgi:hypothetical protein
MLSTSGLLERINWQLLLRELEIDVSSTSLPMLINCPFCKSTKTMTMYPDSFYKSQWLHCKECKESGDLLNLAAAVWDVDEGTVARNLMSKQIIPRYYNFDDMLKVYQNKCLGFRKKHNEFWEKAKKSTIVFESSEVRAAMKALGIAVPTDLGVWRKGMGKLIGFSTKIDAEVAVSTPRNFEDGVNYKTIMTGEYRVFVGKWTDVLVIPYFDMPGRIREFKFIGHDGKNLRHAQRYLCHRRIASKLASAAFMDQVLDTNPDNTIVVDNLEVGLKLQAKNFKDSTTILPLVVVSDINAVNYLKDLAPKTFTLWNPRLSGELFKVFKQSNLDMCVDDKNPFEKDALLSKFLPKVWIDKVNGSRRSCLEVLEEWLPGVNRIEAEATVGLIDFTPLELAEIRDNKYPNVLTAMRELPCVGGKTVLVHGEEYFENEHGWFLKKDGTHVSSLKVRIELIATNDKESRVFGTVVGKGIEKTPFGGNSRNFQANAMKFIEHALFNKGVTKFSFNRKFKHEFKEIILAFSNPRWISEYTKAGWDSAGGMFRFANFSMDKNGVIVDYANTFKKNNTFQTFNLNNAEVTSSELSDMLEDTDTNRGFWALLSTIVSSAMMPAMSGKSEMYLCYSESDKNFENMCSWLGVTAASKKEVDCPNGTWPLFIPRKKRTFIGKELSSLIYSEEKSPCLIEVDDIEVCLARLMKKATVLHVEFGSKVDELQERARKILPAFMAWILNTNGLTITYDTDFVLKVVDLAKDWVKSLGCLSIDAIDNCYSCFEIMESEEASATVKMFEQCCKYGMEKRFFLEGEEKDVKLREDLVYIKTTSLLDMMRTKGLKAVEGLDLQPALSTTIKKGVADPTLIGDHLMVSREWWECVVGDSREVQTIRIAR